MEQEKITLTIEEKDLNKRIDIYLTEQFPKYSRTFFKNLIENKKVTINNKIIEKSSYSIKTNDIIEFKFPEPVPLVGLPIKDFTFPVEILFQHQDFLIIFKPAGLMVHRPSTKSQTVTLVDWLVHHFKELKTVGYLDRPGIVHRLDKDTSGIMIIARNNYAHAIFANLFKNRNIDKTYIAIVKKHPSATGIIDFKITRDKIYKNRMTWDNITGREAVTNFKVLEYFKDSSLVEVHPVTGRTHQIRVHFAAIGHPITGDTTYGTQSKLIKRQALHAYKLSFIYNNILYTFWHDIPTDMSQLIKQLRKNN